MKIDVVMLTKNSEYILRRCLSSIYRNIPVNNLIVIDGFSKDNTIKILEEFNEKYGNLRLIRDGGTRARAREIGIENVETEWFMFVDSDVVLCRGWFDKARKHTGSGVGAVWGVNVDIIPNFRSRAFYKLALRVAKESFKIRGGLHDTLILHDAVKGIKIPPYLHVFEDAYVIKWIRNRGYRVRICEDVYCLHYKPPENWYWRAAVSVAKAEVKCGLAYSRLYRYALYYPFFSAYWLIHNFQRIKNATQSG